MVIGIFAHLMAHVAFMKEIVKVIVNVKVGSNVATALYLLDLNFTLTVALNQGHNN